MSRLILPGESAPQGARRLFVPSGHEDPPRMVVGVCNICGARFEEKGSEQEWQRHVGECAQKHLDDIREEAERRRRSVFSEESWDPEVAAHMRKVGERMIEEGRLEVRPNERAGF